MTIILVNSLVNYEESSFIGRFIDFKNVFVCEARESSKSESENVDFLNVIRSFCVYLLNSYGRE